MKRILHVSDTHGFHHQLKIPQGIDVIIHSGDATNHRNAAFNEDEFHDFIGWFQRLEIKHKIYVPGNHDSLIFEYERDAKKVFEGYGIHYLNKTELTINGLKFYGDPTTPTFGDWCFMAKREKMFKHWEMIPEDVNVLITHTPPKGILDLSLSRDSNLEFCGCSALRKKVEKLTELELHLFGHIHDNGLAANFGMFKRDQVLFSNGSCVEDGKFNKGIIHHGNIIEIK